MSGEYFILLGAFIFFTGSIGFFRFRDAFQRFHPPTKMSILGLGLIILGEGIDYGTQTGDWDIRSFLALPLLIVLSPLAAHWMAKALIQFRLPRDTQDD